MNDGPDAPDLPLAADRFCRAVDAWRTGGSQAEWSLVGALYGSAVGLLWAASLAPELTDAALPVRAAELPSVAAPALPPLRPSDEARHVLHATYRDEYGRETAVVETSISAMLEDAYVRIVACTRVPAARRAATLRWHYDAERRWGETLILVVRPLYELTRW